MRSLPNEWQKIHWKPALLALTLSVTNAVLRNIWGATFLAIAALCLGLRPSDESPGWRRFAFKVSVVAFLVAAVAAIVETLRRS